MTDNKQTVNSSGSHVLFPSVLNNITLSFTPYLEFFNCTSSEFASNPEKRVGELKPMGIRKVALFGTDLPVLSKESFDHEVFRKMAHFISLCWFYLNSYIFFLFRYIAQYVFRIKMDGNSQKTMKDFSVQVEVAHEVDEIEEREFNGFDEEEEKPSNLDFKFEYQIPETTNISNYRFFPERDFSGFVEEPEALTFKVHESYIDQTEENLELREDVMISNDDNLLEFASEIKSSSQKEMIHSFSGFDSDSDPISLSDGYSVENLAEDSESDAFLSGKDFGDKESFTGSSAFEVELVGNTESFKEYIKNHNSCSNISDEFVSERGFDEPEKNSEENIQDNYSAYSGRLSQLDEIWSDSDSLEPELQLKDLSVGEIEHVQLSETRTLEEEEETKCEETELGNLYGEELDELESLWEHQDLIEQLKMELKKVRAIGLPTIFEESESPKAIEEPKPWKIDDKFLKENPIDELQKFYKSYRERMRKFDILNYQKMYAIGFLQLKNPLESMGTQKPLIPTLISHLYRRKSSSEPSDKFIRELQIDLETVYVGQTCLSWEFLHWQYEKARELPDSDPYRSHQYNQVAGEFQQFQVIVQRFVENESFEGPRLQNYVKNRCVLRNLLQVPVIKEDSLKDKMGGEIKGNGAISSEMLEEVMEESIRIFCEFVKAEKDETSTILKGLIGNQAELTDPSDFSLMADIHSSLQKKEKKLKDILKTGNCLVKKFKKAREDKLDRDIFFSQVDMKLVSRVMKMSRITTEQLVWCQKKLNNITFSSRKIHREQSFLLFPC